MNIELVNVSHSNVSIFHFVLLVGKKPKKKKRSKENISHINPARLHMLQVRLPEPNIGPEPNRAVLLYLNNQDGSCSQFVLSKISMLIKRDERRAWAPLAFITEINPDFGYLDNGSTLQQVRSTARIHSAAIGWDQEIEGLMRCDTFWSPPSRHYSCYCFFAGIIH